MISGAIKKLPSIVYQKICHWALDKSEKFITRVHLVLIECKLIKTFYIVWFAASITLILDLNIISVVAWWKLKIPTHGINSKTTNLESRDIKFITPETKERSCSMQCICKLNQWVSEVDYNTSRVGDRREYTWHFRGEGLGGRKQSRSKL